MAAFPPTGNFLGGGYPWERPWPAASHLAIVPQPSESTGDLALSSAFATRLCDGVFRDVEALS